MTQPNEDELRARFLANQAQVRSWMVNWDCHEIVWAEFPEAPVLTASLKESDEWWWHTNRAPWMRNHIWPLSARPRGESMPAVRAAWWFDTDHMFQELAIHVECVLDPEYLAEMLALGVHAAQLKGWLQEDTHTLHGNLYNALDQRPLDRNVWLSGRSGFVVFDFHRRHPLLTKEFQIQLELKPTTTARDGTPLNEYPVRRRRVGGWPVRRSGAAVSGEYPDEPPPGAAYSGALRRIFHAVDALGQASHLARW